jgi:glycosyltransferase involved in cell wall biosynthesis
VHDPVTSTPLFTVFTLTYNRAHTLHRLYESLKNQTLDDFEWLIVDDGSTDGTSALVMQWASESVITIRHVFLEHAGRRTGMNLAAPQARGRYLATIDSDDWYVPTALDTFRRVWETIPEEDSESYSGVVGLCATPRGTLIGDTFPKDVLDGTWLEISNLGIAGDKAGCGRTDVDRAFPHPVIEGENLVIETIVSRRMARHYRLRCVNEVLKIVDYQPDGLSVDARELLMANPLTARLAFHEELQDCTLRQPLLFLRCSANVVRYSCHARLGFLGLSRGLSPLQLLIGLPAGLLVYARDHLNRSPLNLRAPFGEALQSVSARFRRSI